MKLPPLFIRRVFEVLIVLGAGLLVVLCFSLLAKDFRETLWKDEQNADDLNPRP